jgi:hypothetical protein
MTNLLPQRMPSPAYSADVINNIGTDIPIRNLPMAGRARIVD